MMGYFLLGLVIGACIGAVTMGVLCANAIGEKE